MTLANLDIIEPTSNSTSKGTIFRVTDKIFYPQLVRLRDDFGFSVIQDVDQSNSQEYFFLCDKRVAQDQQAPLTPYFNSLSELEDYAEDNILDLLHSYLVTKT